jgi:hydroxymethylpyrimidine/phosphomethylpyrimidine kinase
MTAVRAVLTIAGSDSIAGAGVQADLKTFAALGVYGTSAVTAITSQNRSGVLGVFIVPLDVIRSQIEASVQDVSPYAVKTGMLATAEIVEMVADVISTRQRPNLVVDPVMMASSAGRRTLLSPDAVEVLKARLLPLAAVVTPNVAEAEVLSGIAVRSLDDAREAARRICDLGPSAVVVKGGHLEGEDAIDVLYDGAIFTEFSAPRWPHGAVHGTGCTFASAVAAGLASGHDTPTAVQRAKTYVTGAIEHALLLDDGARLLNHFWIYTER